MNFSFFPSFLLKKPRGHPRLVYADRLFVPVDANAGFRPPEALVQLPPNFGRRRVIMAVVQMTGLLARLAGSRGMVVHGESALRPAGLMAMQCDSCAVVGSLSPE